MSSTLTQQRWLYQGETGMFLIARQAFSFWDMLLILCDSDVVIPRSPLKNSVIARLKGQYTGLNYRITAKLHKQYEYELVTLLFTLLGFGGNQDHYGFELKIALDYTVPLQLQAHCGKHCPVTPYKRQFQEAEPLSCPISKAQSPFQVSSTTKIRSCKGLKTAGEIFLPYLSPFSRGFCDTLTGLGVPWCSLSQRHS